jgi:hypothetical protein
MYIILYLRFVQIAKASINLFKTVSTQNNSELPNTHKNLQYKHLHPKANCTEKNTSTEPTNS